MVNIVVVGWYGTETIGDRAILAGLFHLFAEVFDSFAIQLGSFYPVVTDRTLLEDSAFYGRAACGRMGMLTRFNSSKAREINQAVDRADLVVVGGGPLADIDQMYMLEYTFAQAHRKHKKTALLGCGVGPLESRKMISSFYRLLKKADLKIFRDDNLEKMGSLFQEETYFLSCDPAVFAAMFFKRENIGRENDNGFISVNFREIVSGVAKELDKERLRKQFLFLLRQLLESTGYTIRLIPMHTFYIGGDDRYTLNWLCNEMKSDRIYVQNLPLTLEETMGVYLDSQFCVGMRFHSVVLQTLLNGKNYILDYTYPNTGKIFNFLKQFDLWEAYRKQYVSLVSGGECMFDFNQHIEQVVIGEQLLSKYRSVYVDRLRSLLS